MKKEILFSLDYLVFEKVLTRYLSQGRRGVVMKRLSLFQVCIFWLLVLLNQGCDPPTSPCHSDSECGSDQICKYGVCVDPDEPCSDPFAQCGGASCIDTWTNPKHCGGCGIECGPGEHCSDGTCSCMEPLVSCGGECLHVDSDRDHCGDCETSCLPDAYCDHGECVPFPCSEGLTDCDGDCVNLQSDRQNCGGCGQVCEPHEFCSGGECGHICHDGFTFCDDYCANLQSDRAHCGECGVVCESGEICSNGECVIMCQDGLDDCGGYCVNLQSDRFHCGGCGEVCESGEVCSSGLCVLSCQDGLTDCGGDCVNIQSDRAHCGDCNGPCDSNEYCSGGECREFPCHEGFDECSDTCVDTANDPDHCGSCDHSCDSGEYCSAGHCVEFPIVCPGDLLNCSETCVDISTNPNHCGACNASCNSDETCSDDGCIEVPCFEDFDNCSGICIDTSSNPAHCGVCEHECEASEICHDGACVSAVDSTLMVTIPSGLFRMGCNEEIDSCSSGPRESPAHDVDIPEYKIDLFEVTVGQYRVCVDNNGCTEPTTHNEFCNWRYSDREDHPVNGITWYQAKEYCEWVGKRLCSESEWEKAARGTDGRIYPWGNEEATCDFAVMCEERCDAHGDHSGYGCGEDRTWPVGSKPSGVYGLYDMAGNIWEWVEDDFHVNYDGSPSDGSAWIDNPRAERRVLRGGSMHYTSTAIRASFRLDYIPSAYFDNQGVRCCQNVP